jgi:FkbM family methyltransferase
MRAALDPAGALKYLALRSLPFVRQAWARHRDSGLRFRVHLRDVVGRTILRRRAYEPLLTNWLLARLRQDGGGLFVDVGANIGWFALQAARAGQVEQVLAVEPDVLNHALLRRNIEANGLGGRVLPVACALGDAPGLARLSVYKDSNLGKHSLVVDHGHGGCWVPVLPLDGLLASLGLADRPLAALKVDVEGFEPRVFAGAARALARCATVLVELSPELSRAGGLDVAAVLDRLQAAGFEPQAWDQAAPLPGFEGLRRTDRQVTVGFARRQG